MKLRAVTLTWIMLSEILAGLHHLPPHRMYGTTVVTGGPVDWQAVAYCESHGDWHAYTPPYYGGLQESLSFWVTYGGLTFAARPDLATEAQQITVAERGLAVQGLGAWPVCQRDA